MLNSGNDDQEYVVQTGRAQVSSAIQRRVMGRRKRHGFLGWLLDSDHLCLLLLVSGLRLPSRWQPSS